jgi:hypothetical protein
MKLAKKLIINVLKSSPKGRGYLSVEIIGI